MKQKRLEDLSVFELSAKCEQAASRHGQALEKGDSRTANRQYDVLSTLGKELRRRGSEGQAAILRLTRNADLGVRIWAASFALRFAPEEAESVLQEIASGPPGIRRLGAETLLEEWRNGNLKFDD